jgi:transposase
MRAADLFEDGVIPDEVARQVGESHQIVSDWRAAWRRSGRDGLRGAGRAGRLPKLSRDQLASASIANSARRNGRGVSSRVLITTSLSLQCAASPKA